MYVYFQLKTCVPACLMNLHLPRRTPGSCDFQYERCHRENGMVMDIHLGRPFHYTLCNHIVLDPRLPGNREISHCHRTPVSSRISKIVALFTNSRGCLSFAVSVQTCDSVLVENNSRWNMFGRVSRTGRHTSQANYLSVIDRRWFI